MNFIPLWCKIALLFLFYLHSNSNMAMRSLLLKKRKYCLEIKSKMHSYFSLVQYTGTFFSIFLRNKGFLGMYSNLCFHFKFCILLSYYCLAKPLWKSGSAYHTILTYSGCIVQPFKKKAHNVSLNESISFFLVMIPLSRAHI